MDEHVARLQDMLRCERVKVSCCKRILPSEYLFTFMPPLQLSVPSCQCTHLQLRCNQQEAELRRREQHSNRLKERLSQLPDRHREKGPCETHSVDVKDEIHRLFHTQLFACMYIRHEQETLTFYHLAFFYPAIEVLNFPHAGRGKREQPHKSFRPATKCVGCYFPNAF